MEILKAILLGIVQGITEFLPISSSGHLSLFQYFMNMSGEGSMLLNVLLHIGTLLAVIIVFYKTIFELIVEAISLVNDIFKGRFKFKGLNENRKMLFMFVVSSIPLLFLLIPISSQENLMGRLKVFSEDDSIFVEGICFLLTALLLIIGSRVSRKIVLLKDIDAPKAFGIGIAQVVAAAFPGISRSGATISTGMIFGISKEYMVKFSFILGIPAILAANAVEIKNALEYEKDFQFIPALFGIASAAIVGVLAIKTIQLILKKNMFQYFGYYCALVGIFAITVSIVNAS